MKIDNGFFLEEKFQPEVEIDYLKAGMQFAGGYANDVKGIEEHCFKSEPYRYCIQDVYMRFVRSGELVAIEKLPQADKQMFFDTSNQIFPEEVPPYYRKQLCVFLYLMNFMFEKYFVS